MVYLLLWYCLVLFFSLFPYDFPSIPSEHLGPLLLAPESETLEWSPANYVLTNLLGDSEQHSRLHIMYFVEYPIWPHHDHTNQGVNTDTLTTIYSSQSIYTLPVSPDFMSFIARMTPRLSPCVYLSCLFKISFSLEQFLNLSWIFITLIPLKMPGQLFCKVFLN